MGDVRPGRVTACGSCGGSDLALLLDMGLQPLAEGFGGGERYPLELIRCAGCSLVQLSWIVDQREIFRRDHPYATGNTRVLRKHFSGFRDFIALDDQVVDIGANDGTLLKALDGGTGGLREGVRIAVEPTDQILKCAPNIVRYQEFFTEKLAVKIREECGPADVVTACNIFAHVPNPHDFLNGVRVLLAEDGEFVTENHSLAAVIDGLQVDTVYHEHLRYYSVASLSYLLALHGLEVIAVDDVPVHGGSFRVRAVKKREDSGFRHRAQAAGAVLRGMLWKLSVQEHAVIYGIGATTRATPLIHFAGIRDFITCICEISGSEKIGQKMPGTQIPVVDEKRLIQDQPPYALLFSWHLTADLIPKLRAAGYKGKFIIPLPEPRISDG